MNENDKKILEKYDWGWAQANKIITRWQSQKDGLIRTTFLKREFAPRNFKTGDLLDINPSTWEMTPELIYELHVLRMHNAAPIVINRNGGFAVDGHGTESLHYGVRGHKVVRDNPPTIYGQAGFIRVGRAADLTIMDSQNQPRDIIDQALMAYKILPKYHRFGIYPFWNRPGLHVDYFQGTEKSDSVWFQEAGGAYRFFPRNRFHECLEQCVLHMHEFKRAA